MEISEFLNIENTESGETNRNTLSDISASFNEEIKALQETIKRHQEYIFTSQRLLYTKQVGLKIITDLLKKG